MFSRIILIRCLKGMRLILFMHVIYKCEHICNIAIQQDFLIERLHFIKILLANVNFTFIIIFLFSENLLKASVNPLGAQIPQNLSKTQKRFFLAAEDLFKTWWILTKFHTKPSEFVIIWPVPGYSYLSWSYLCLQYSLEACVSECLVQQPGTLHVLIGHYDSTFFRSEQCL